MKTSLVITTLLCLVVDNIEADEQRRRKKHDNLRRKLPDDNFFLGSFSGSKSKKGGSCKLESLIGMYDLTNLDFYSQYLGNYIDLDGDGDPWWDSITTAYFLIDEIPGGDGVLSVDICFPELSPQVRSPGFLVPTSIIDKDTTEFDFHIGRSPEDIVDALFLSAIDGQIRCKDGLVRFGYGSLFLGNFFSAQVKRDRSPSNDSLECFFGSGDSEPGAPEGAPEGAQVKPSIVPEGMVVP